jgi:hypothetical protein
VRLLKRLVLFAAALAGGGAAAWRLLIAVQGDAELTWEDPSFTTDGDTVRGHVTLANRGREGGVAHRVEGRVVKGGPGRVVVTRKGSRPHRRGWWVSYVLKPGESCVAEVEVELDTAPAGPVVVELDAHELGRRLIRHRTVRLTVAGPASAGEGAQEVGRGVPG